MHLNLSFPSVRPEASKCRRKQAKSTVPNLCFLCASHSKRQMANAVVVRGNQCVVETPELRATQVS